MIRERPSSNELVMPYESWKRLGFRRACKMLGLHVEEKKA